MMRFLMIIFFVLLAIFSSYKSYTEYKNYKIVKNSNKSIELIQKLNHIFTAVELERSQSAIYLGYEGKLDFNTLQNLRDSSDNTINATKEFIKQNPNFEMDDKYLSKINESLQYVRSRVDVVSDDHNEILFSYYQDDIVSHIILNIRKNIEQLSFGFPEIKRRLLSYIDILEYKKVIEDERSFIAFILSHSKKMSKDDFIQWENILSQSIIPNIDVALKTPLSNIELNKILSRYRAEIASGATKGHYPLTVNNWFNSINKKIDRVNTVENMLFSNFKTTIDSKILSKKWIILYGIVAITSLLLGLILLFSKEKTRNRRRRKKDINTQNDRDVIKVDTKVAKPTVITEVKKDNDAEVVVQTKQEAHLQNSGISGSDVELFSPLEVFTNTIEPLKNYAYRKGVGFDYFIDSSIPSHCMGNVEIIKQILTLLIEHALKSTPSNGVVDVKIEKNAQSKTQSVLEFNITDSNGYIGKSLKSKIDNVVHDGSSKKNVLGNKKTDLIYVAKSILKMGGTNNIQSRSKNGSTYSFTLSLKIA